jgi:transglutaminase-like putative cysteine protease
MNELGEYLQPTYTIDSENSEILKTARELTADCSSDQEKAVGLFYFVRDEIRYNLYMSSTFEEDFKASRILQWRKGYCVQKAVLLTALGRAVGIPSRLVFATIRNNRIPEKVVAILGDNIFRWHGYNQFYLKGKWVSAAATFDRYLCEMRQWPLVEFTGDEDAVLPERDLQGRPFIEYLEKHEPQADLPFKRIYDVMILHTSGEKRPWLTENESY